jgi:hypothetical protein
MKKFYIAVVVLMFVSPAFAADSAYEQEADKLMKLEEEIRQYQDENEERKEIISQLEKKVQCTYQMVKGYERCEEQFEKQAPDYGTCIEAAREQNELCMQQ